MADYSTARRYLENPDMPAPKTAEERAMLARELMALRDAGRNSERIEDQARGDAAQELIDERGATTLGRFARNLGYGIPELIYENTVSTPDERKLADAIHDRQSGIPILLHQNSAAVAEGGADLVNTLIPLSGALKAYKNRKALADVLKRLVTRPKPKEKGSFKPNARDPKTGRGYNPRKQNPDGSKRYIPRYFDY